MTALTRDWVRRQSAIRHRHPDHSYFPELATADLRFAASLDVLEQDPADLDRVDDFTRQANSMIKLLALDETQARYKVGVGNGISWLVHGREGRPTVTVLDLSDCAALPWAEQAAGTTVVLQKVVRLFPSETCSRHQRPAPRQTARDWLRPTWLRLPGSDSSSQNATTLSN